MKNFIRRLRQDEEGASLLEYTTLLAIILGATIAVIIGVGTTVNTAWTSFSAAFKGVLGAGGG